MKSCLPYSLLIVLCCFSAFVHADTDQPMNGNNVFCVQSDATYLVDTLCGSNEDQRSTRSKIRGYFYGQIVKHIWKNSKERDIKNQANGASAAQTAANQHEEKIHHQSVLNKMLNDAVFDIDASAHKLIFSIKMRF